MLNSISSRGGVLSSTCAVALALSAACGSAPSTADEPSGPTGVVRSDIIGGAPIPNATVVGTVSVIGPHGQCTGEAIQNNFIVTARHCVTTDGSFTGPIDSSTQDYLLFLDQQQRHPVQVIAAPAGMDVAAFTVDTFFDVGVNDLPYGYSRPIYSGTDQSLVGTNVLCNGYGDTSWGGSNGQLTEATIQVASVAQGYLYFLPNSNGSIQAGGDSGSTCFTTGAAVTGILSGCNVVNGQNSFCVATSPDTYRSFVMAQLSQHSNAHTYQATTSNTAGDFTTFSDPAANGNSSALVTATANWNPGGTGGIYSNHNFGVWYTGSNWSIFNEDQQAMTAGPSFNVSVGGNTYMMTAGSSNTFGDFVELKNGQYNDPNELLIATPNWNGAGSGGVYSNHAVGVWYDGTEWTVYNEDTTAMQQGAKFNVRIGTDGTYTHYTSSSNIVGDYTTLDNPNINGQSGAMVFVTHNFTNSPMYWNHPLGVWYTGSRWAIFNEDGATMPSGLAFNVMVRP